MNEDAVMISNGGFFEVVPHSGVGINKTPWKGYRVKSLHEAYYLTVTINLEQEPQEYKGEPIKIHYTGANISYGLSMRKLTVKDIENLIQVLQDAVEFVRYIENNLDTLN